VTERRNITPESGHGLERTIFFSDAVIAIALTLLALELHVPAAHDGKSLAEDFGDKMGHEYAAFLISFAVISMFWFNHHRFFQNIARLTHLMIVLNLGSLFAVVLMPFATKMTTEMGDGPQGTAFYAGVMCLWGMLYLLMVWEAQRNHLWSEHIPPTALGNMVTGTLAGFAPFLLSIPVAFVDAGIAKYMWILVAPISVITARVRQRIQRRHDAERAEQADRSAQHDRQSDLQPADV
jgi:TMEM175 potassium channel family protein